MSHYTVKGWNNAGPLALKEPMPIERALQRALELRDEGFTQITLTDVDTQVEAQLDYFIKASPHA